MNHLMQLQCAKMWHEAQKKKKKLIDRVILYDDVTYERVRLYDDCD